MGQNNGHFSLDNIGISPSFTWTQNGELEIMFQNKIQHHWVHGII